METLVIVAVVIGLFFASKVKNEQRSYAIGGTILVIGFLLIAFIETGKPSQYSCDANDPYCTPLSQHRY